MKKITIAAPIYNEEELLNTLYNRIKDVQLKLQDRYNVSILFVNDGSSDNSRSILDKIAQKDKSTSIIHFSRNFGLEAAISGIIDNFSGDALVILDGDLQDPPELIPQLLEKWEDGFDVVYTVKKSRKESFFMRIMFQIFYKLQSHLSDIKIPQQAGNFSLLDKKVVNTIKNIDEKNKYFPGIRAWVGFNQTHILYDRDKRYAGKPKMNLKKLFNLALNGIFSYTTIPQRISYFLGLFFIILGFVYFIYVFLSKYVLHYANVGWASTIMTIYIIGGFELITIALLGEYVTRIFEQTRNRPNYLIDKKININNNNES